MSTNLSPEEIAALLRSVNRDPTGGEETIVFKKDGVSPLDLTLNQERIFRGRLPGLELIFERFCALARNRLSRKLDRNVFVSVAGIQSMKFGGFLKKLPLPSSLHLFRMAPLPSQGILVLSTPLVFALVDVLLGGKGKKAVKSEGREFSGIEARLVGKIAVELIDELQQAWQSTEQVECTYVRSEINPLAVSVVPSTDSITAITLDLSIEETSASLTICLPAQLLQPMKEKLSSGVQAVGAHVDPNVRRRIENHLRHTEVEIRAILAEGKIKVKDLLKLQAGDLIHLDTPADRAARILIQGEEKFKGKVGSSRGRRSVRIP